MSQLQSPRSICCKAFSHKAFLFQVVSLSYAAPPTKQSTSPNNYLSVLQTILKALLHSNKVSLMQKKSNRSDTDAYQEFSPVECNYPVCRSARVKKTVQLSPFKQSYRLVILQRVQLHSSHPIESCTQNQIILYTVSYSFQLAKARVKSPCRQSQITLSKSPNRQLAKIISILCKKNKVMSTRKQLSCRKGCCPMTVWEKCEI